jgi:hypothetical protein
VSTSSGRRFVDAIAARDHDALCACLSPTVDFKGLTPGRLWEADSPGGVDDVVLETWFPEHDRIAAVSEVHEGEVADTSRISYRFDLETPDGPHVAEQQAYYREGPDGIAHLRILCSGFRPRST